MRAGFVWFSRHALICSFLYSLVSLRETVANPTPSSTSLPAFSRAILDLGLCGVQLFDRAAVSSSFAARWGSSRGHFLLFLLFPDMLYNAVHRVARRIYLPSVSARC